MKLGPSCRARRRHTSSSPSKTVPAQREKYDGDRRLRQSSRSQGVQVNNAASLAQMPAFAIACGTKMALDSRAKITYCV
jgi:hypothetical protein